MQASARRGQGEVVRRCQPPDVLPSLPSPPSHTQAAARRGQGEALVRGRLDQLEALMPGLVNLHRLKAADWCAGGGGGG